MCARRGHRGVPGAGYLQPDEQAAIHPTISPSQHGPRQGRAEAVSLGEREPPVQGQEASLGQAMAIPWAPSMALPDGCDLAEDVGQLGIYCRANMRFSCSREETF